MNAMKWSDYQLAIYDAVRASDSLLIEAVAGSGKTTTLVEAIRHVPPGGKVAFLAYNKAIAIELGRRVDPQQARCMTLHAAGWNAWRQHLAWDAGDCRVDKRKYGKTNDIVGELLSWNERKANPTIARVVALAKAAGIVPLYRPDDGTNWGDNLHAKGLVDDTDDAWLDLMDHHGISPDDCQLELARRVLAESIARSREVVDFDDMLYLPVVAGAAFERFDTVFVDEAQDLSGIQHVMLERMAAAGGRVVAVGDRHQCQPPGAKIRIPGGCCVPIESLKDGDLVVSVDFSHSCFKASGDKIKVCSRGYIGNIIEIVSAGRHSRYTPNHVCVANPKPLERMYAVYLMEKNKRFRIGSTLMGVRSGSGIRTRMLSEDATRLWVLSLHSSKADACFEEAMLGATYGIPERTFVSQTADGKMGLNQSLLDRFWASIPPTNVANGLKLLAKFGREFDHPLVSRGTVHRFKTRRPSEIEACNLMTGMLVLHSEDTVHYKKHQWKPIDVVLRYKYDGPVYSLDVENKHSYIADGIATHNSIYGFRGAHASSMDALKDRFQCRELPLSVSYRCPLAVVDHARQWCPQIEAAASAAAGLVEGSGGEPAAWQLQQYAPGDAILCRVNRPLVATAFRLIGARVPARVLGRDIGQGLAALAKKLAGALHPGAAGFKAGMLDALAAYRTRERERLVRRKQWAALAALYDRVATLGIFVAELGAGAGAAELVVEIESLFGDAGAAGEAGWRGVTLTTVHKAKGLEWPRVFILDAGEWMPGPWARRGWELAQEDNIRYVAATRAMKELRYVSSHEAVADDTEIQVEVLDDKGE